MGPAAGPADRRGSPSRGARRHLPRGWDGLAVAGRTDTGVHATGQVASVTVTGGAPAGRAAAALNTALPPDVSVLAAEEAPEGFHARFSASARSYRYLVLNRVARSALEAKRSLWWPRPVDLPRAPGMCGAPARRARLQRLHARREPARGVPAHHPRGRLGTPRRSPPFHRHRGLVPPPHGADAGRARCSRRAPSGSRTSSRDGRASRVGRPRRRGGSISSGVEYMSRTLRVPAGARSRGHDTIDPCGTASSSSTSTARSSTRGRSSSPRCATRR